MTHISFIEDIDKAYVSEYDKFLQAFDKKHPKKSPSQEAEIEKSRRLSEKRDNLVSSSDNESLI